MTPEPAFITALRAAHAVALARPPQPARGAAMRALDALAAAGRDLLNPFDESDAAFLPVRSPWSEDS